MAMKRCEMYVRRSCDGTHQRCKAKAVVAGHLVLDIEEGLSAVVRVCRPHWDAFARPLDIIDDGVEVVPIEVGTPRRDHTKGFGV